MISSSGLETSSESLTSDSDESSESSHRFHEIETSGRKTAASNQAFGPRKGPFPSIPPIARSSTTGHDDKCPDKCLLAHAEKHIASARTSRKRIDSERYFLSARSSKRRNISSRQSMDARVDMIPKSSQRRSVFPSFIDSKSEITDGGFVTVTSTPNISIDKTTITEESETSVSKTKTSSSSKKVQTPPTKIPTIETISSDSTTTTVTNVSDEKPKERKEEIEEDLETITTRTTHLGSMRDVPRGLSIKDELLGISLPGMSQAMAAHTMLNRSIWFMLFGISCGLLMWNLFFLYSQYRETPYNPEIKVQDAKFVFPDFYICHSIIPSISIINYHLEADPDGMNKMFKRIQELKDIAQQVRRNLTAMPKLLPGARKFWLNKNDRLTVSILISSFWDHYNPLRRFKNPPEQTIIDAYVNERKLALTDFEIVPHMEFYSCLKFRNSSLLKSKNHRITLYLYLDESQLFSLRPDKIELLDVTYAGHRVDDKSEGFELIFSAGEYYPGNSELVLKASPGTITRIFIEMEEIQFKRRTNYLCQEKGRTFAFVNHINKSISPISYQLDYYQCYSYQWSILLFEKCGCVEAFNNVAYKIIEDAVYCQNATHFTPDEITRNIICQSELHEAKSSKQYIQSECFKILPCNFRKYKSTSSFGTWPTVSHTEKFVTHVMEPNYKERTARGLTLPAWKNVLDAGKRVPAMVRANVAKVDIYPASSRGMLIQDKEAYPIFNFLSDIGGVFGLYLDVSFLTFFLFFQAIYRVYKILKHIHYQRLAIRDIPRLLTRTMTTE